MAIINCPECGKEISDTSKKCINCGYKFKKVKKSSIITIILIIMIIAIIISTTIILIHKNKIKEQKDAENSYKELLLKTTVEMNLYKLLADYHCAYISSVWHNAIFEDDDVKTNKYTKTSTSYYGKFVDFSTAINNYTTQNKESLDKLNNKKGEISKNVQRLKDIPNSEFKEPHEKLLKMYSNYSILVDLARFPTGTYKDYNTKYHEYSENFDSNFEEFKVLLPEVENVKVEEDNQMQK